MFSLKRAEAAIVGLLHRCSSSSYILFLGKRDFFISDPPFSFNVLWQAVWQDFYSIFLKTSFSLVLVFKAGSFVAWVFVEEWQ